MSEELKRIDPAAIPVMFRDHDITPAREHFHIATRGLHCGCVNTILAVAACGRERAIQVADEALGTEDAPKLGTLAGLDPLYAVGLARGWDDIFAESGCTIAEAVGFADGRAAWLACEAVMETLEDYEEDDTNE